MPADGFLERVREIATDNDIPLVFDEITSGWRIRVGGVHQELGVNPDIVVYGKTLANGYPMAAIIGRAEAIDPARNSFMSSSYWTERVGPAAALATLDKLQREDVPSHLVRMGQRLRDGWTRLAVEHDLEIDDVGLDPLVTFHFEAEEANAMHTLFTQEMLDRGFLASERIYVSYAHTNEHVDRYLDAVDEVFELISEHHTKGTVEDALDGPVAQETFERLN
jgi:glutamate-1-semialdehyde aminotransferase